VKKDSKCDRGYIVRYYEGLVCVATRYFFGDDKLTAATLARREARAWGGRKEITVHGEVRGILMYATSQRVNTYLEVLV
jgi:hypothetical protein